MISRINEKQLFVSLSVEEYDVQLDKATEVYISVNKEDQNIDVMIENNGIGIETNTMWSKESIGLQNICSQVQYLHGTVSGMK